MAVTIEEEETARSEFAVSMHMITAVTFAAAVAGAANSDRRMIQLCARIARGG